MIFGLAIIIYLNVQKAGLSSIKLEGSMRMEALVSEMHQTGKYESQEIPFDNMVIYQKVEERGNGLVLIKLEARNMQGKLIAEQKHLVYAPVQP